MLTRPLSQPDSKNAEFSLFITQLETRLVQSEDKEESKKIAKQFSEHVQPLLEKHDRLKALLNKTALELKEQKATADKEKKNQQLAALFKKHNPVREQLNKQADAFLKSGNIYSKQNNYGKALAHYRQALMIYKKVMSDTSLLVIITLDEIATVFLRQEEYSFAEQCYEQIRPAMEQIHSQNNRELANFFNHLGHTYFWQKKLDQALHAYQKAFDLLGPFIERTSGQMPEEKKRLVMPQDVKLNVSIITTLNHLGNVISAQGNLAEAMNYYERALAFLKRLSPVPSEQHAMTLNNMAELLFKQNHYSQAIHYHQEALQLYKQMFGEMSSQAAHTLNNMGRLLCEQGRYPEAMQSLQQALLIRKKLYGENGALTGVTLDNMATVFLRQGHYEQALSHYRQVLAIYKSKFGQESYQVGEVLNNLGNVFFEFGEHAKALTHYEEALALQIKLFGEQSYQCADTQQNMANALAHQGQYEAALKLYQKALTHVQHVFGEQSSQAAGLYLHIGNIFSHRHQYEQAFVYYSKALTIKKRLFGDESEPVSDVLSNRGSCFAKQGQYDQALNAFQSALAIRVRLFGETHAAVADIFNNMGTVLSGQGQYEQALQRHQKALAIQRSLFGENNSHVSHTLESIGNVLADQGKFIDAMRVYENAFFIHERVYGKNSSQVAELLCNMSNVLTVHRLYAEAIQYWQQALGIFRQLFGEQSDQVATTLASIAVTLAEQNDYSQALVYFQQALAIFKQVLGEKHEQVARTLKNMGAVFSKQRQFKEGINYYKQAFAIYVHLHKPEHFSISETRHDLAAAYMGLADTLAEKKADDYYQEAVLHYHETLHVHRVLFGKRRKELSTYDFLGHNRLLHKLALVYVRQGKPEKAGELYYAETRYDDIPPIIILYYASQAIQYLLHRPAYQQLLVELYTRCADIGFQRKRYGFAIKNIQKALALNEKDRAAQEKLITWQKTQSERDACMDEDLSTQLEDCYESYDEIQFLILQQLESSQLLSEHIKNRITEWAIKMNSLLDSAFGRFAREAIYQPGRGPERQDLYYPFCTSHAGFLSELKAKQIITDPEEFKEDDLGLNGPESINIRETLKKDGYLDQKNCVTEKAIKDPLLEQLDMRLDPVKEEIAELLKQTGKGKPVTKTKLGPLNNMKKESMYKPPAKRAIAMALQEKGLITLHEQKQPHQVFRLTPLFDLEQPDLTLALKAGQPDEKQFARYERLIIQKVRNTVSERRSYRSLDTTYSKVYGLMEHEQPYIYYSAIANEKQPGLWQRSWLEKIAAISNASKHICLTPQSVSNELCECVGSIRRNKLQIIIHYIEPLFYPWTFMPLLKGMTSLSDAELSQTSQAILRVLREKQYIQKGTVVHPLARPYLEAVKNPNHYPERERLEKAFFNQVQADFPVALRPYAMAVSMFLLRHLLQSTHIELYADHQVELHALFERALIGADALLMAFGEARSRAKEKKAGEEWVAPVVQPVLPAEKKEQKEAAAAEDKALGKEPAPPKTTKQRDWIDYHQRVTEATRSHRMAGNAHLAGEQYDQSAQAAENVHPCLALHYYRKAFYCYGLVRGHWHALQKTCLALSKQYVKSGLRNEAIACLKQGIKMLPADYAEALHIKQTGYTQALEKLLATRDVDLYSQMEHAKQQFLYFEYLCFRLACDDANLHLRNQARNRIADLIIKLRHLLDQSFTRFIHEQIYLPNNKWVSIHIKHAVKFYAFASPKELQDELIKKEIIQEDKEKISLPRNFPDIYQLLEQAQPFHAQPSNETWLSDMIALSNQIKHVGLLLFQSAHCSESLENIRLLLKRTLVETENVLEKIGKTLFLCRKKAQKKQKQAADKVKAEEKVEAKAALPGHYPFFARAAGPSLKSPLLDDAILIEERHQSPEQQRRYDKRFGLILIK